MKIVVGKKELLKELSLLQGILERKATIPILSNVLLTAADGQVSLLATDLDVALRSRRVEATVGTAGSVTLPARKLCELVGAISQDEVTIEEAKNRKTVTVAADRFESHIQTLPAAEFPTVPEVSGPNPARLPGAALTRMITHTRFATSTDTSRYYLHGALLVLRPESLSMVATDGHRLALMRAQEAPGVSDPADVLVPHKTVIELARVAAGAEVVEFSQGPDHLFFRADDRLLISKKINANFPSYERVIPQGHDKRLEFDRDRLAAAVRRVRTLANERSKAMTFTIGKGAL